MAWEEGNTRELSFQTVLKKVGISERRGHHNCSKNKGRGVGERMVRDVVFAAVPEGRQGGENSNRARWVSLQKSGGTRARGGPKVLYGCNGLRVGIQKIAITLG